MLSCVKGIECIGCMDCQTSATEFYCDGCGVGICTGYDYFEIGRSRYCEDCVLKKTAGEDE